MRRLSIITLALLMTAGAFAQQPTHTPANKAQVEKWMTELSNWGRWGKDDQLGALNFITPAKRREAMALAKDGIVVSLGTYLLDGIELKELADTAARLNRYTFMLVVAPLRAPGSSGSLVNPLAMF